MASRGRPKGSKNKPKSEKLSSSTYSIKFEKQILGAPIMRQNMSDGIINWGVRNDYPLRLDELYIGSVTHKSCIDFAVNAIVGGGVEVDIEVPQPNYHTSWNEFIRAIAFDYTLYGGFAFQIIKNKDGKTYSFFNQPFETVRMEPMDEDGVIEYCQVSADWTAKQKYPPVRIPIFGFQEDEEIKQGQVYMFVYVSPNPISSYYPIPSYIAGIKAIQAEVEYQNYDLKSIMNGFVGAGSISLPPVGSEQQKQAIINNIQSMFTGSDNANSILVFFREDSEDTPVGFTPFSSNGGMVDLYEAANERTVNRIIESHKISSKGLIGLPMDNSGFSDSGALMQAAYDVYNTNVASSARVVILSAINNLFALNGVEVEISLKPLTYITTSSVTGDFEPQDEEEVTEREENTI